MKRICLINCYFGRKWPNYFEYFSASCRFNPTVDFLIFSNIAMPDLGDNLKFVFLKDLQAFNDLATRKLALDINLTEAYKLCDMKPAYGAIFEDYIQNYDFWGHCDIDVIFGQIRDFITDDILNIYDVISPKVQFPAGFFTLYKNVEGIKDIYRYSKDYEKVFKDKRNYCFDECNFQFHELQLRKKSILEVETEIESMAAVVAKLECKGAIKYYHETIVQELLKDDSTLDISWYCWDNGILFNTSTNEKFLLLHLIHIKNHPWLKVSNRTFETKFYINKDCIGRSIPQKSTITIKKIRNSLSTWVRKKRLRLRCLYFKISNSNGSNNLTCLHNRAYMVGGIKCAFSFPHNNEMVIHFQEGENLWSEVGSLQQLDSNTYIYTYKGEMHFFKYHLYESTPFRFVLKEVRSNYEAIGYLLNENSLIN